MTTPSGMSYSEFTERVGTEFVLHLPDGAQAPMVLTECTATGPEFFSLIFKAGPPAPIEQSIYAVSADGFGPDLVFLVPVRQRPNDSDFPLEYQAIFNSTPVPGGSA